MIEDKVKESWFEISEDELNARMEKQKKQRTDPVSRAVDILEAALDSVLKKLGVNVEDVASIPAQMDALGIMMSEHTDERAPQLNGFFVYLIKKDDIIPYAWIGSARLESGGRCFCDIQYFQDNRLVEAGGEKLVGG